MAVLFQSTIKLGLQCGGIVPDSSDWPLLGTIALDYPEQRLPFVGWVGFVDEWRPAMQVLEQAVKDLSTNLSLKYWTAYHEGGVWRPLRSGTGAIPFRVFIDQCGKTAPEILKTSARLIGIHDEVQKLMAARLPENLGGSQ